MSLCLATHACCTCLPHEYHLKPVQHQVTQTRARWPVHGYTFAVSSRGEDPAGLAQPPSVSYLLHTRPLRRQAPSNRAIVTICSSHSFPSGHQSCLSTTSQADPARVPTITKSLPCLHCCNRQLRILSRVSRAIGFHVQHSTTDVLFLSAWVPHQAIGEERGEGGGEGGVKGGGGTRHHTVKVCPRSVQVSQQKFLSQIRAPVQAVSQPQSILKVGSPRRRHRCHQLRSCTAASSPAHCLDIPTMILRTIQAQ